MSKERLTFDDKGQTDPLVEIVRQAAKETAVVLGMDYAEQRLPENVGITEMFLPDDFPDDVEEI